MIEQYYPSKRKVTPIFKQPEYNKTDSHKAWIRGLSVDVYRERVTAVAKAFLASKWKVGDEAYPFSIDAAIEHGKCRVMSIVQHFDQYGTVAWNDPPFILTVMPLEGADADVVTCTSGWLVEKDPRELTEC